MSRLYLRGHSDARRLPITARGHEAMNFTFLYGSRDDSKKAVTVNISYPKGKDKPDIEVVDHLGNKSYTYP